MKQIFILLLLFRILSLDAQNKESIYSSFVDQRDSCTYKTVNIGEQVWMCENLKYNVKGSFAYDNNEANVSKYGRLYLWDQAKLACPKGWHLPTKEEWLKLTDFLGGNSLAGGAMKTTIDTEWLGENIGASNSSGFSAMPAGYKDERKLFNFIKKHAVWWSASNVDQDNAIGLYLSTESESVFYFNFYKKYAFSVRCVKNAKEK